MSKTNLLFSRVMASTMVAVQIVFFPAFALANHDVSHVCPEVSGIKAPTGSDAKMFNYNPATCKWHSAYYIWDPVTKTTSPTYDKVQENGTVKVNWLYSPASGEYEERRTAIVTTPTTTPTTPTPSVNGSTTPTTTNGTSGSTTSPSSSGTPTGNNSSNTGGASVGNTGPNSNNTINNNQNNNGTLTLSNNATITNGINSTSNSGNAIVQGNTQGGSASTGDAEAIANILNLLQSSWDPSKGDIATFNADIYDHYGDLLFDPSTVLSTGPNSQNSINSNKNNNLDVTIQNDGRIVNNVDLTANSGDAKVANNTTGGDATTGDANAVANIFNLVNSMIVPGSSFIGTINILGNLNGDILLPTLLASIGQTGPNSSNTINNNQDNNTNITSVDNRSIANNTNLSAASGNATVAGNTTGGDATTGAAKTELNIFNLTGREIIGTNGLLVFSNVLGSWSGFIFDAPTGTNSVLGTGPGSTNTVNANTSNNLDIDSTSNTAIENNVTASARSGDASVTGNTTGGNASTGDATASANIFNLVNSQLDFSSWFGVLFINVFGDWTGSFGVDTEAGNTPTSATNSGNSSAPSKPNKSATGAAGGSGSRHIAQVFGFVRSGNTPNATQTGNSGGTSNSATTNTRTASANQDKQDGLVLAAGNEDVLAGANSESSQNLNLTLPVIGVLIATSLLGAERWLTYRGKKKAIQNV